MRLERSGVVRVSCSWIYKQFHQDRALLAASSSSSCDSAVCPRRRQPTARSVGRSCIPQRTDISERPAVVEARQRIGNCEGDTILGKGHQGATVTLVNRVSKDLVLRPLVRKTATLLAGDAVTSMLAPFQAFVLTLTFDFRLWHLVRRPPGQATDRRLLRTETRERGNEMMMFYSPRTRESSFAEVTSYGTLSHVTATLPHLTAPAPLPLCRRSGPRRVSAPAQPIHNPVQRPPAQLRREPHGLGGITFSYVAPGRAVVLDLFAHRSLSSTPLIHSSPRPYLLLYVTVRCASRHRCNEAGVKSSSISKL